VRHALGKRSELRVEVPNFLRTRGASGNASGLEDGSVGFKVMLSPGEGGFGLRRPRVSLIGAVGVPLGSRDFRQSGLQPEAKLLLGSDLSERVSLSSNLNAAYRSEEGERFGALSGSVSLGVGVTERVGSDVELFGFSPAGRPDSRFINGGLTYLLNDDFQVDARLGLGLNNDAHGPDVFFGFGVARRF